ncbi:MAG: hypothetical protein R3A13_08545 [Bdellovibrionota bacterium]
MNHKVREISSQEIVKDLATTQSRLRMQICELLERADLISDSIARSMIQAHCIDMLLELEGESYEFQACA